MDSKPKEILLVAITRLGDLLQASPTVAGLKKEHPNCRITVVVDSNFSAICRGIPGIDRIVETELAAIVKALRRGPKGIVEAYQFVDELVEDLKQTHFDFALNISSSGYTALLMTLVGIDDRRGWVADAEGCRLITNPWSVLFAAYVYHQNRDFNAINIVDSFRCVAGVKEHPKRLQYNIPSDAETFVEEFLMSKKIAGDGPLICLQPGASQQKRQWAPAYIAKLINLLIENLDARVVLTGAKGEKDIADTLLSLVNDPHVVSAVGETNLDQLASLLSEAELLVTGDTGPMHMSVAVGTPVVAVFLASALCFETGPYGPGNIVIQPQIDCNPCNPNFPCSRPDCHDQISPELVAYLTKLRIDLSDESLNEFAIPQTVANPSQVGVYVTEFDEDGFLDFKRLNGFGDRRGRDETVSIRVKKAYKEVWKREFGAKLAPVESNASNSKGLGRLQTSPDFMLALNEIDQLVENGKGLISELQSLISDVKSPPARLGEVSGQIEIIDKKIEEVGLSNPELGVLTRVFVMEKQNMRGSDPSLVASELETLYESLARRSQLFEQFYNQNG